MKRLIAVTGGIGVGKSVVCRILRVMGYEVYDCDIRAKHIMDADSEIHAKLVEQIDPRAVECGVVNRPLISQIVFNDSDALARLNNIVHSAVLNDLQRWRDSMIEMNKPIFVETAIPVQSRVADMVDEIWQVTAPLKLRVDRVIVRSGLTEEQILARINAQCGEYIGRDSEYISKTYNIINDGIEPLLPCVTKFLRKMFKIDMPE